MDYKRVLDHVRAKLLHKDEEPLEAVTLINATNELLISEEYECLSTEFKEELT